MGFAGQPRGWERTAKRILARDGRICWLCGEGGATSVDHVVPRAMGGSHLDSNLRAAHRQCNSRKGARAIESMAPPKPRVVLPRARGSRWS